MASERILFVDDDPVSRRSFARMMRQNGLLVDLATDGDEAWELVSHFPYAVIVTDLRMPGMDGMMLIDQIRELQPDPVCLLVTGCSQFEWYDAPEGKPGVDVIKKPWNGGQLLESVHRSLCEYRARVRGVPKSVRAPSQMVPEVGLVGLGDTVKHQMEALVDGVYRTVILEDLEELPNALRAAQRLSCCFVEEGQAARMYTRALQMAAPEVPIIVLGSSQADTGPVDAIRSGAHDWLPNEGLRREDIERVVRLAVARAESPRAGSVVWSEQCNPGLLAERLRQAISRARRYCGQTGLLLVDLDGFRSINVALGYEGGDALLELVAQRLRESIRESDAVVRLRQDEFALILEDLAGDPTIEVPAQRVLNTFATPFRYLGNDVVVTASIGGAVFPSQGQDAAILTRCAEQALEQAKREGRNRYRLLNKDSASLLGAEPLAQASGQ